MRTTLDIEDDILRAAKELAESEGTTAGKVISRLARLGLIGRGNKTRKQESRNGVPLLPRRNVVVTLEQVERIMNEDSI